jgi:hypothetical protein
MKCVPSLWHLMKEAIHAKGSQQTGNNFYLGEFWMCSGRLFCDLLRIHSLSSTSPKKNGETIFM